MDASAVVHDGLDDLASGSDDGVVDLGWDLDLYAHHIGLFSLDLLDFIPGFLHIGLLASDGDHVRVRATLWQVNLGAEGKMVNFREQQRHKRGLFFPMKMKM